MNTTDVWIRLFKNHDKLPFDSVYTLSNMAKKNRFKVEFCSTIL